MNVPNRRMPASRRCSVPRDIAAGLADELRALWRNRHLGLLPQSDFDDALEQIRSRLGARFELEDRDLRYGGTRFVLRDRSTRSTLQDLTCGNRRQEDP